MKLEPSKLKIRYPEVLLSDVVCPIDVWWFSSVGPNIDQFLKESSFFHPDSLVR